MKASIHMAQRFLERVLNKNSYSKKELYNTYIYLSEICKNIMPRGYRGYCPLPENSKFVIAYNENVATTILPKEYVKYDVLYNNGKLSKREYRRRKYS